MRPNEEELIYDWNVAGETFAPSGEVMFDDETLRDGIQSPSVVDPPIEDKIEILHLMDELGIHTANLGLPGAGRRAVADVTRLATEIERSRLSIRANCAARTVRVDIEPIVAISQRTGHLIEACVFIGSSPIRQYAEDWPLDRMLRHTEEAVRYAKGEGLPVMYVTEDTTRAHPDTIRRLYTTAIECGADRICVCDTCGHVTPWGVRALLAFVREVVAATGRQVGIDWHGHKDRALSVANTLAAIEAGATRVHGTALGIGERSGNTPLDLVLVNLKLLGVLDRSLEKLPVYCRKVAEACRVPIPRNYPVMGDDAFETATGVHAAAVIKAFRKGDAWLADRIYSGVPAGELGMEQRIRIGPMSGRSNVLFWLERRGIEATDERVDRIFDRAKSSNRLLTDEEIEALL